MNDFLQDVLDIRLSNKLPERVIKKQVKTSSVEFADGEEVAQGFGEREPQGQPASDPQTCDKAEGKFADGEEVKVEEFKASSTKKEFVIMNEDGKILSLTKEGKKELLDTVDDPDFGYERAVKFKSVFEARKALKEVFGEDIPADVAVYDADSVFRVEDVEASEAHLFVIIDEDGKVLSINKDHEQVFLDTVDEPDGGFSKAVKMAREQAEAFVKEHPEYEIVSVEDAFKFVEESAEDVKILKDDTCVLMDGDGKILSYTKDGGKEFLDTVDDLDGGYERAVKFNSYREAHQALWDKFGEDIPEDVSTIKSKEAFAFVEDSKCKKD